MKKVTLIMISVILIALCSCSSIPKNNEKITVNGMIYDTENRPAVNYKIYLDGKYAAITDIGGRFTLNNIKCGQYDFTGNGIGYLNMKDSVEVFDKGQILYIRVPTVESKFQEAYTLINQHKYTQAELCIQEVLDTEACNSTALFFMSVIEYLEGDIESSKEYKEQLLKSGEDTDYVHKLEKIISDN